jgi:hypothetical protein
VFRLTEFILIDFAIVYYGMAIGRLPGLSLDRSRRVTSRPSSSCSG